MHLNTREGIRLNAIIDAQQVTIAKLRTWLNAVEWIYIKGIKRCPMCNETRRDGHDPQCNWVEDRAALSEDEDSRPAVETPSPEG